MKTFGKHPARERLEKIKTSPNYQGQIFQNILPTPMSAENVSTASLLFDFMFGRKVSDITPAQSLPSVKTDLLTLADEKPQVVWFGHSSYLAKHQGRSILVDPVFCGYAAPISTMIKAFPGSNIYGVSDLPEIDVLIITHDHYDHLDYLTVVALKDKVRRVVTPLGVGAHLEHWGYDPSKIVELDWWQTWQEEDFMKVTATPARHFSGRSFTRNKTLWASFVIQMGEFKIFAGGDSGYDDQFKRIGEKFGGVDIAMVECGQYNEAWPYIHMFPEQTAQAAADLGAKTLFPVHWGKFVLSKHAWTESIERVTIKAQELKIPIATPKIGEVLSITTELPTHPAWWRKLSG